MLINGVETIPWFEITEKEHNEQLCSTGHYYTLIQTRQPTRYYRIECAGVPIVVQTALEKQHGHWFVSDTLSYMINLWSD